MNRFFLLLCLVVFSSKAQDSHTFFGGFESNAQWYLNDKDLGVDHPEYPLRSNSYLLVNYKHKNWSAGIQAEAYEERELLNYNPKFNQTNVATYFAQYKNETIDVTLGYFYEQFGSGLLFRGWEDRALGINNALRGARIIYKPLNSITLKGIYGRQRTGFEVSEGQVYGFDSEFSVSDAIKMANSSLSIGLTYVGRYEVTPIENPNFKSLTNAYAARLNYTHKSYYFATEFNYKSDDAVVEVANQPQNNFIKPGNALLVNMGYSKKGFGLDGTFRRLENMGFYSERGAKGNPYNDRILNFIPSLTKQHHYNLANIYVYQSQPNVILGDATLVKAGEIGGQIDLFYDFKKGSTLGGKNGMKVAFNFSNWNALGGDFYILNPKNYETDFFGFGKKYFSDYNIEVTKKWHSKLQTQFSYINQYYNKKMIEETAGLVKTNIIGAEMTYKTAASQSIRIVGEHMWADSDKKNWASATAEFNVDSNLSFYVLDMYNYGNDDASMRNHYYNIGSAYRKNATRIALSYGRQRGGLVCVGGVCRFVPESSGIALSLNTTF